MEEVATDKALMKAEPRSSVGSVAKGSELRRQIRLPMTNISVDKLPPITDDKVRLPEASPTSPLVKVSSVNKQTVVEKLTKIIKTGKWGHTKKNKQSNTVIN